MNPFFKRACGFQTNQEEGTAPWHLRERLLLNESDASAEQITEDSVRRWLGQ
jgi:hypothetical protein